MNARVSTMEYVVLHVGLQTLQGQWTKVAKCFFAKIQAKFAFTAYHFCNLVDLETKNWEFAQLDQSGQLTSLSHPAESQNPLGWTKVAKWYLCLTWLNFRFQQVGPKCPTDFCCLSSWISKYTVLDQSGQLISLQGWTKLTVIMFCVNKCGWACGWH